MSHRALTIFTALSVAAHTALFGIDSREESAPAIRQENTIEVGLVVMPRITRDFSKERARTVRQPAVASRSADAVQKKKPASPPVRPVPDTRQAEETDKPTETVEKVEEFARLVPEGDNPAVDAIADESAPVTATEAAPLLADNPAPTYPEKALRYGWEGEVWLRVDVNRHGGVDRVRVDRSSGYPILDRAAMKTVRTWQFQPARIGAETTEGSVRVPIRFHIKRT